MLKYLSPQLFVDDIYHIDLEQLMELGIRGIIMDLDNTLVPWNGRDLFPEVLGWIAGVRGRGLKMCIVSNNHPERGENLAETLNVPAVWRAIKPRRKAFRKALKIMGLGAEKVAVVGDQVFTDMLGGNRLGMYTILVRPLDRKEFVLTRMMRHLERVILFLLHRQGYLK